MIAAARLAIGTPFVHQGRVIGVGLDCAGLVVHVANSLGIEHHDQGNYARTPSDGLLEAALDGQQCLERVSEMQRGDVLLMRFLSQPQHLAIFTGETIVHSYQTVGKVCEHGLDDKWLRRIVGIYRFAGVEA